MSVAFASRLQDGAQPLDFGLRRAKFVIPPAPRRYWPRADLVQRLAAIVDPNGSKPEVAVVSAPVGWGKTTFVAAAARERPAGTTAWCTLDRDDNDPREFAVSILEAILANREANERERSINVDAAGADPLRDAMRVIAGGPPTMLVLDECEHIGLEHNHATIGRLIRQAPPNLALVLVTNRDVHLSTRGIDRVHAIRSADVAFSIAELRQIFADEGFTTADQTVRTFSEWTEGAATAVAFAVTASRDARDRERIEAAALRSDVSAHVVLFGRILDRLPHEQRAVLVSSSIVDVVSGDLAADITGLPDAPALLQELVRSDLFFDPIPGCPNWYRHRHPTRELLLAQLRHERHELADLYRIAAQWFASVEPARALTCAIHAADWPLVCELVRPRWISATLDEVDAGLRMVPHVPDDVERNAETALVAAAIELEDGNASAAQEWLSELGGVAIEPAGEFALFEVLLRLRIARDASCPDDIRGACALLEEWCEAEPAASWPRDVRLLAMRARAEAALIDGDFASAAALLEVASTEGLVHGRERQVANATASLAVLTALGGRLRRAAAMVEELGDAWFAGSDVSRGVRALAQAICAYHADDLSLAQLAVSEARAALRPGVYRDVVLSLTRARIALSVGDTASAARLRTRASLSGSPALVALATTALALPGADDPVVRTTHPYAVACADLEVAVSSYEARRLDDAWAALEHALTLSERNCYRRILLDSEFDVRALLGDYIAQARPFGHLAWQLLQRLPVDGEDGSAPIVETLTERELAVLRHLPTMKSNREIAGEMYFSVNTVKTHLKSIYRKLGVNRRREAVEVARARSLL
jgi:LuxR family transcriptional regulator, maltose regulon positive regulatory protein